eukprot:1157523-Pelagomonas_calceolata.AAC.2
MFVLWFQSGAGTLYQKLAAHPDIILVTLNTSTPAVINSLLDCNCKCMRGSQRNQAAASVGALCTLFHNLQTGSSRNQFWAEQGKSAEKFAADNSQAAPQLQADPGKRESSPRKYQASRCEQQLLIHHPD